MAIRNIVRSASQRGFATPTAAPIRIDTSTNTPFYNGTGSGTTEKEIVDVSSTQTLTNKTITSPTQSGGTISAATLTGNLETDTKVLAANATFTTSALATLTGLTSQTLVAGKTYNFEVFLMTTQTTNGGLQVAFLYNTAVLASLALNACQSSAAAVAVSNTTVTTNTTPFVNNKTAVYLTTVLAGTLVVTTGGTIDIQVAQNTTNSDTTTVALGSYARFTRVN